MNARARARARVAEESSRKIASVSYTVCECARFYLPSESVDCDISLPLTRHVSLSLSFFLFLILSLLPADGEASASDTIVESLSEFFNSAKRRRRERSSALRNSLLHAGSIGLIALGATIDEICTAVASRPLSNSS